MKNPMHDNRWNNVQLKEGITNKFGSHVYENLELDFEDNPATDYREKGDCLRLASTHLELLTVDKRAMYIMAIEIATAIDGQISEDDKESWLSVEEFKNRHEDILSMSYEQANELSLRKFLLWMMFEPQFGKKMTAETRNTSKFMVNEFMTTRTNEIILKRRLYKKSTLWLFGTSWKNVVSRR